MSKYPLNSDDGELTEAEQRRLIDEVVIRRMQVVSDDHLATYWAAKKRHDQERDRLRGQNNLPKPNQPFPSYNPSELHELRAVITEDVRQRVMDMVHFPLDEGKQQDNLDMKGV